MTRGSARHLLNSENNDCKAVISHELSQMEVSDCVSGHASEDSEFASLKSHFGSQKCFNQWVYGRGQFATDNLE